MGRLSDRWWIERGRLAPSGEHGARFGVTGNYTEATLRLLGSQSLRNVFVEAEIGEKIGGFWLYAARTADHMTRFGHDDEGYLRLQTWRRGRLVAERRAEWPWPDRTVRLRLEIIGDGAVGRVDGRMLFDTRLRLPTDGGLGWAGLGVHAFERGRASVVLRSLSAGGLPAGLAWLPAWNKPEDGERFLARVRSDMDTLAAICPSWYSVDSNGEWMSSYDTADRQMVSLFARYHRLWLLPVVACASPENVRVEDLQRVADEIRVDGFILLAAQQTPESKTVAERIRELRNSRLRVLIVTPEPDGTKATAHPAGAGREFNWGMSRSFDLGVVPRTGESPSPLPSVRQPLLIRYEP